MVESWNNFNDYNFSNFGGENREQVLNRHIESLKEHISNVENNAQHTILFVGHSRGLNTLLAYLGKPSLRRKDYVSIENIQSPLQNKKI